MGMHLAPRRSAIPDPRAPRPGTERVGVLAPVGRDAALIAARLASAGVDAEVFASADALCDGVARGRAGVVVLTSETLRHAASAARLRATLAAQPAWSDVPLVLLVESGRPAGEGVRLLDRAGVGRNATVLERPLSTASLVGTVRIAVLARRRQVEVRDLLLALEDANRTLEARVESRTAEVRRLAAALTLAEQEERRRVAYLLHDDLQQRLHGLQITMALLEKAVGGDPTGGGLVEKADAALAEAVCLTRSLSHDLAPPVLRGGDLAELLHWLADWAQDLHGLTVEVDAGGVSGLDEAVRVLLYRAIRELLFNAAKHAGTDRARLTARPTADGVRVVVEDEGVGFETGALVAGAGGLGLAAVRERLELVGGRFEVASGPGRGTRVTIEVPTPTDAP